MLEFKAAWGFKFCLSMTDTIDFSKSLNISELKKHDSNR